jgi:hypothetical protein
MMNAIAGIKPVFLLRIEVLIAVLLLRFHPCRASGEEATKALDQPTLKTI